MKVVKVIGGGGGIVLMVSIFIYSFSYVVIGGWVVIEDNFYMLF